MTHLLLAVIYLSFISLGLPDSLLGAAWPSMRLEFAVPLSWAGGISLIIALGTVISSLQSDRLTHRFGTGRVTAFSVAATAVALLGFSVSHSYWLLCLWAIPYGLGAGSVDASLNNYVALHYASRHMSWMHCMWGVGAAIGPCIMGWALAGGRGWSGGYRAISMLQFILLAGLMASLPLWKRGAGGEARGAGVPLKLGQVFSIPGAKQVMAMFFCYCALEQTALLWGSSFLVDRAGVSAGRAATLAGLFCGGITAGRAVSGFMTLRFSDGAMIRIGTAVTAVGAVAMLLPLGPAASMAGLMLVGLGCAPIYPCVIHSTPAHFGAENSQAVIGVQMASAYLGTCLMPPLFGLLAGQLGAGILPVYLLALLALMAAMYERLIRK